MAEHSIHVVRRKTKDGTIKEYFYKRKRVKLKQDVPVRRWEKASPGSVQFCINLYKHSMEWRQTLKPITQGHYTRYLKIWEHEAFANKQVKDITRKDVRTIRDSIADQRGISAGNVFVRVTGAWFRWMIDTDWVTHSPVTMLKPIPGQQELPTWTEEEFVHAERTFNEPLRRAIVLARYTGQRRGDLIKMLWTDDKGDVLLVSQQKGRRYSVKTELEVPVHPALRAELDAWKTDAVASFSRHIITRSSGKPWNGEELSKMVGEAVHSAGLPRLGIHGLRKLAATSLAQMGCSSQEIMAITGHKTLAMIEKYTRAVSQRQLARQAMDRWEKSKDV